MNIAPIIHDEPSALRVLIAEDQPAVAKALQFLLEVHDIPVVVVHSPNEAINVVLCEKLGVVLQDMNFVHGATSGEDGLDLFRRIREIDPKLPVLAITAWTSLEVAIQMVKEGASDYMAKPWNDDKLISTVKNLLQARTRTLAEEKPTSHVEPRRITGMHRGDVLANRFVIENLAGAGGMGEVYRGLDQQTGQTVAVKILRGDEASDIARFEREARLLQAIDDPHVVRHITHGTVQSGDPYLVMEWLEGEDLSRRLARGSLDVQASVMLCVSIADALGVLHARGIVHRDLKPSNVFLDQHRTDNVKLLDFGIARSRASTRVTATGMLVGTLGYMAPELANGTDDGDERADVFALGCVLFECLTGKPAFVGTNPMAVLSKVLFEDPPRLRAHVQGVPDELDAFVWQLMSRTKDDRPSNGRVAADELRGLLNLGV
jgi:FixJ family two-component response regulator